MRGRGASWRAVGIGLGMALVLAARAIPAQQAPAGGDRRPAEGAGAEAPKDQPAFPLETRFRFLQHYSARNEAPKPGLVGQYQAAFRETVTVTSDTTQGTPKREQTTAQVIVSERPTEVNTIDPRVVNALVRHYDFARFTPDPFARRGDPKPLADLTVWYRTKPEDAPEVLMLDPNRRLLEEEYRVASNETYVPDLGFILPEFDTQIGDSWPIPRQGTLALVKGRVAEGALMGKLGNVVAASQPEYALAVIQVAGRVRLDTGAEAAINARLAFAFLRPGPEAGAAAKGEEPTVTAEGSITQVVLAQEQAESIGSGGADRRRRTTRRDFHLEIRPLKDGPTLRVPDSAPKPTEANSWLTYTDPQGRFTFRMPQEFGSEARMMGGQLHLAHLSPESRDVVVLQLYPQSLVDFKPILDAKLASLRASGATPGPPATHTLPESDWHDWRVTRTEIIAQPPPPNPKLHIFSYAIQFGQNASLYVEADTQQEKAGAFRNEIEAMLRTFRLPGQAGAK